MSGGEVVVTQADRDAAAEIFSALTGYVAHGSITTNIRCGNADSHAAVQAFARHRIAHQREAMAGWRDIASAPRDGTVIDVWRAEGGRDTVLWGLPSHECGEAGSYCDSDWHTGQEPSWVCATFNETVGGKHNPFTHWMPLPEPPAGEG